ncbi:MAG: hypothetical protein RL033_1669 [Pseudomonadota bacterium]|jgi:hypothetical protein
MRQLLWLAFGCSMAAGSVMAACSGRDVSLLQVELEPEAVASGQLQLALTAQGSSGALYRLRQAQFDVFSVGPGFSPGAFLNTENDPLATTLETTLDIGDYAITLFSGWVLEKVQGGEVTRVQARLLSPESQEFSIAANEETSVRYRFETNGDVVEFGQGRLIVAIEVEERRAPEPDPVFTLGEPLEIVDGVISADSNPYGISAALFSVTSPLGTELTVTEDTGALCVRGHTDVVIDGDFANRWGGLWGLEFLSTAAASEPDGGVPATLAAPWDLGGGRVAGLAFTITGPGVPPMRLQALPGGADPNEDNFCRDLVPVPGVPQQVPFGSLDRNCWEALHNPMVADSLQNVAWLVPADALIAHAFDVCVTDVRPLLR